MFHGGDKGPMGGSPPPHSPILDNPDAYNTCDYDSEVDPGMNKAVKVAEVVANIEAADPTYRERTLSVKRPGSPTGAGSDRVLKLKQKQ